MWLNADLMSEGSGAGGGGGGGGGSAVKRFEIKKWNAVALWSWGKRNRAGNSE